MSAVWRSRVITLVLIAVVIGGYVLASIYLGDPDGVPR